MAKKKNNNAKKNDIRLIQICLVLSIILFFGIAAYEGDHRVTSSNDESMKIYKRCLESKKSNKNNREKYQICRERSAQAYNRANNKAKTDSVIWIQSLKYLVVFWAFIVLPILGFRWLIRYLK